MFATVVMATRVYVPKALLDAVDRKARALQISRIRLVLRALVREVGEGTAWSAGFFDRLTERDDDTSAAVDDRLRHVRAARRSKPAPRL